MNCKGLCQCGETCAVGSFGPYHTGPHRCKSCTHIEKVTSAGTTFVIEDQPKPKRYDDKKPIIHHLICEDLNRIVGDYRIDGSSTVTRKSVEMVQKDLMDRLKIGIERYGAPLQPNNGRNAKVDGYQEIADLLTYFRQDLCERYGYDFDIRKLPIDDQARLFQSDPVAEVYWLNLHLICKLRAMMS